jgi:two-component system chemotaxis response regulator CheY
MSTILVVDDSALMRDPIAQTLRTAGYETLGAENGRDALEILRILPVDLIVLDLFMPVMNGLEFLKTIRANAATANLPVILLSAAEESEEAEDALKYGVDGCLLKSHFSLRALVGLVKQRLNAGTHNPTHTAG